MNNNNNKYQNLFKKLVDKNQNKFPSIHKYLSIAGITLVNIFIIFPYMKKLYTKFYSNNSDITHVCYFDFEVDEKRKGRIDIGLYSKEVPENFNNFMHLVSKTSKEKNYEESKILRICPNYLIHFGDIKNNDGTGHISNYIDNRFIKDEISNNLTFCDYGVVAMANRGKDTNGSQFFITLDDLPFLNGKYTIVGQVLGGYQYLLSLAKECGSADGAPKCNAKITKTGIYNYEDYMKNRKYI